MKGKLEDGTPVEIEKPGAIERWTKWWEFVGLREVKTGEIYLYSDNLFTAARDNEHRGLQKEYWIASEIPRASASQLATIGMRERDGRPVKCKEGDCIWGLRLDESVGICSIELVAQNGKPHNLGKYRFVLEPVVNNEAHTSCEGCENESKKISCRNCYAPGLDARRENYKTKQPAQPEELRFSVGEINDWLEDFTSDNEAFCKLTHPRVGIKAFTERRRENGN